MPASAHPLLRSNPAPWMCWAPGSRLPCYPNLFESTAFGDQVWFSDSSPFVLGWDGKNFSRISLPAGSTSGFRSMDTVGPDDLWGVAADQQYVLRWHDGKWQVLRPAANLQPIALDMLSATEGWLIGYHLDTSTYGIYHWDGNDWDQQFTYSNDLVFISMASNQFGWAINRSGARILWNGIEWTEYSAFIPNQYTYDLVTLSPTDAWVGQSNGLAHWDGETWKLCTPPYAAFIHHIAFNSSTDGWAASEDGRVYHWDGTDWALMPYQTGELMGAVTAHSGNVWASGQHGAVYHLGNAGFEEIAPNAPDELKIRRNGIDLLSSLDGWAVGNKGLIEHWNGESWQSVESPTTLDLQKVVMLSPTSGWAVGNGGILRYRDGEWTVAESLSTLYDIDMLAEDLGWVVGSTAIFRWNGSQWQAEDVPGSGEIFSGVDMLSATAGWAVSLSGQIYILDEQGWSLQASVDAPLHDIVMLSVDLGFAVGDQIYRFDGTTWEPTLPPTEPLSDVWYGLAFRSPDDGYAVGMDGQMAHWNGQTWNILPKITSWTLTAIDFTPGGTGWVVGDLSRLIFLPYTIFMPLTQH